jgi:hypothetical protein
LQASKLLDTPFNAVVILHPLKIENSADDDSRIPVMILISQSEGTASLQNMEQGVKVEILEGVDAGFLASGANLNNDAHRKVWDRGWETVGRFFGG